MMGAAAASAVAQIRIVIDDTEQTTRFGRVGHHRGHRGGSQNQTTSAVSSPTLLTPSSPPASLWGFGFGNGEEPRVGAGSEDEASYVVDYELDEVGEDELDSELDERQHNHQARLRMIQRDHHRHNQDEDEYDAGEDDELELDDEEEFYNRFATEDASDGLAGVALPGLVDRCLLLIIELKQ